ncbi:uncharacterized protein [Phaseolus vulgaris]|uniref:uncharacterized protein n=1 Tax=Phaseolus vulgaris TaxID=3885 RepID=UPI0035CCA24A
MKPEESIADVQKRFTHIVNHLTGLGKVFDKEELNIKVLKCLDRSWQLKVTAISESRDLSKLSTAALFGKLMEHELELKRLKEQETVERKPKGLALKASAQSDINEEKEDVEHDETISLLTKRFSRFRKKKRHIKIDCPNNQSKDKSASKKVERSKGSRAYISWEEDEVSSTSGSSTESEETNMCFMVKDEGSISDSVSEFSMESDNYDQLLAAFKETNDEANRLAVICSKLQKVNNVLAPKVKTLEEELHKAKTDLGRENLESLLGSQNAVFNKNGIGYNPGNVTNVKRLPSFFVPAKSGFSFFNSGKKKGSKRTQWYLDSGCSKHMTGDLTKFTNLKLKAEGHVTYGDNNCGRILGRGIVGIEIQPLLRMCFMWKDKSIAFLVSANYVTKDTRRLAHIHTNHLNILKSKDLISSLPNIKFQDNRLYDASVKGKQIRSSFNSKDIVSTKQTLDVWHMDLFGPSRVASLAGNLYALVIVDDYSRYTLI